MNKEPDYTNFHRLIEIGFKLNHYIEKDLRSRDGKTKERVVYWKDELNTWLEENFEKNGIKEHHVKEFETIKNK